MIKYNPNVLPLSTSEKENIIIDKLCTYKISNFIYI